jgi:outer membrane protein assembly factor BamD (BamD/ComL family)
LYEEITQLRNLPRVPPGRRLDEVPQIKEELNDQLARSLVLTEEYLKKYPKGPNADDVLIQRVDTIRLQAVINDKPLDEFRKEAQKVLTGNASEKVKSTVAFMLVQADLQDAYKALREDQQMSEEQKDAAWRQTLAKQAGDYLKKYPKSEFAKEFYGVLIQMAVRDRDFERANALLDQLRANFPDEPAIPQIAEFIQQAAATQAAASQFGPARIVGTTTQPGAATRTSKVPATAPD